MTKFSIRFVCQGGGIDIKSAFLAASLKEYLCIDHELVACVPEGAGFKQPDKNILSFLESLDVEIMKIRNPLAADYPTGNKLACLAIKRACRHRVFLDSDILCLRKVHWLPVNEDSDLAVKLEDWNHHSDNEWRQVYRYFGLDEPSNEYRSTVLNESMPLYFNAGVIIVKGDSDIPEKWIEVADAMDKHLDIPRKRPNLDQLSLSMLVVKDQYRWREFDEEFNYPAELRSINPYRIPYFSHYHDPMMILADETMSGVVSRLCRKYSALYQVAQDHSPTIWGHAARNTMESTFKVKM